MKQVKRILLVMFFTMIFLTVTSYGANLTVSSDKATLEIGQTAKIVITGTGITGKVTIASSNSGVVTVNQSSIWIENGSITVEATAKGAGSATVKITPVDIADSTTGEALSLGAKSVSLTVNASEEQPNNSNNTNNSSNSTNNTNNNGNSTNNSSNNSSNSTNNSGNSNNVNNSSNNSNENNNNTKPVTPTETVKSSNANLSNLGIKPNDFKGFKPANTSYTTSVPNEVETVEVYANKGDTKQTITGTGKKSLNEGSNKFTITVTAEDGTKKDYTITVIRLAKEEINNPNVEQAPQVNVALSSLSIEGVAINQAFSPEKTEYTAVANVEVEKLQVKAIANISDAEINIAGAEELTDGENIVTIRVKSSDGSSEKVYTIKVTMEGKTEENEENEIQTIVGATQNNNGTGGDAISIEKILFCIGIGVVAFLGAIFAFIRYKKDTKDVVEAAEIDFIGDISAKDAIKDATYATSKLVGTNMELAEEETTFVKRKGRHF